MSFCSVLNQPRTLHNYRAPTVSISGWVAASLQAGTVSTNSAACRVHMRMAGRSPGRGGAWRGKWGAIRPQPSTEETRRAAPQCIALHMACAGQSVAERGGRHAIERGSRSALKPDASGPATPPTPTPPPTRTLPTNMRKTGCLTKRRERGL